MQLISETILHYRNGYFSYQQHLSYGTILDISLRESLCIEILSIKSNINKVYYKVGDRLQNIIHTKIINKCSTVKYDLFRKNINVWMFDCSQAKETVEHFFLFVISTLLNGQLNSVLARPGYCHTVFCLQNVKK